jgi:hypothetical protein
MDFLNAYFYAKDIITKPSVALNDETPKERAKKYLGSILGDRRKIDYEKTKINKLIMPIFDDLDLFSLNITKQFLKIKEHQKKVEKSPFIEELVENHGKINEKVRENYNEIKLFGIEVEKEFNNLEEDFQTFFKRKKRRIKKITKLENIIKRNKEHSDQELTKIRNHYDFWNEKINFMADILEPKEYILQTEENYREIINYKLKRRKIENLKMKIDDIEILSEINHKVPVRIINKIGHYKKNDLNERFMYPPKKESYIGPSTDPFIEDVDD